MAQEAASIGVLLLLTLVLTSHVTQSLCPWEEPGLTKWSDASTWEADGIPTQGKHVDIKSGMSVLLDVSPPALRSMKIEHGGRLVWGNVEGLVLKTAQIELLGDLIVGQDSPDCRMEKKAKILLTGLRDSDVKLPIVIKGNILYRRKMIMVRPGGSLELHGAVQKSWTKLAATIPSVHTLCATVFDIQNSTYKDPTPGVHVMVWNADSSVHDFQVFNGSLITGRFPSYITGIPDGKIVAMAISEPMKTDINTHTVYSVMEFLGAKKIRTVGSNDSYAFIVLKGQRTTAQEVVQRPSLQGGSRVEGPYVNYTDWSQNLQFSVKSVIGSSNPPGSDFKVFNTDVIYPVIKMKDDVSSWKVGDEIVVASTDYDWRQAEVKKVVECSTCLPNQVRVDGAFEYLHYGEITRGVDERAEVGLLTRSVVIEGEVEDHCYARNKVEAALCDKFGEDTNGGHVMAEYGTVAHHVQHVELYHMGQQGIVGSYPLHFHLMRDSPGQWMRNNSAHRSFQRCYTVHMTDRSEVSDNVCYDHLGHGLFLEDSAEQKNIILRNLIIGTRHGTTLMSDMKGDWCAPHPPEFCDAVSSFWITHPNNIFEGNVAAGSDNSGFRFIYADFPVGLSNPIQANLTNGIKRYETRYTPILRFRKNAAHSNEKFGVVMDERLSTGEEFNGVFAPENAILRGVNNYLDPRVSNNETGQQTFQVLEGTSMHHNKEVNMHIRGGNVVVWWSSFADAPVGFYATRSAEGTTVEVYDSVFVGETENRGQPFLYTNKSHVYGQGPYPTHYFDRSIAKNNPDTSLTAIQFAEGPFRTVNCYFDQYKDWYWNDDFQQQWGYRPLRRAGALSFRQENLEPSMASNGVYTMKFSYCDKVDNGNWVLNRDVMDGNTQIQFRDYDGSVTGQAGTQLVRDLPFLTADSCVYHDNWNMSACPYRYAKLLFTGTSGVLQDAAGSRSYPVTMRRDDKPDSPFTLRGDSDIEFLTMTNRSYTVHFNGTIPRNLTITAMNMDRGDTIRLGICMPKDTTRFRIRSDYAHIYSDSDINFVNSLTELDQHSLSNAVYVDANSNMVFFKLVSQETRQSWREKCPGNQCVIFSVERLDGGDGPRDCSSFTFPAFDDKQPEPESPPRATFCGTHSYHAMGAPLDDPTPPQVLTFTCIHNGRSGQYTGPATGVYVGCFLDYMAHPDLPRDFQVLPNTMTVQHCLDRCRQFGYKYAALQAGTQCRCGNDYNKYLFRVPLGCALPCSGNPAERCGGNHYNSIYRITN